MTFKTDEFRASVEKGRGLASNNRYRVILPTLANAVKADGSRPSDQFSSSDLNFYCTAARIPGKNITTIDRQVGLEQVKVANGYTFGDVSLTFYLTNDYAAKKYFELWSECIMTPTPPYTIGFHNNYAKSVMIEQLDKLEQPIYTVELVKAFPTTYTEVELNNQAQGAALEFTVSLSYASYLIR
jgi:hypothetical protein